MRRAGLVAVVAVAVLLWLAGAGLSRRQLGQVSVDAWAQRLGQPRPLDPTELGDAQGCITSRAVHPSGTCTLSVPSTWSFRRRALVLVRSQGALTAEVTPDGHPERSFSSTIGDSPTSLPVDRAGARVLLSCAPGPPCSAIIR